MSAPAQALRVLGTNEKVTGVAGAEMLRRALKLHKPPKPIEAVLDMACGGGTLTGKLLNLAAQDTPGIALDRLVAADIDPKMVAYTSKRAVDEGWTTKTASQSAHVLQLNQQNAAALTDESFSHIFSNFGIFFSLDDGATLAETLRLLRPGGVAGFTSWKSIAWWTELALPALAAHLPDAKLLPPDPTAVFPSKGWTDVASVRQKLEGAGFVGVEVVEYAFPVDVTPKEFAEACAVLMQTVATRVWSAEDNAKFAGLIEGALLSYMTDKFGGGMWDGKMTAIISLGQKHGGS
ncbi:hypothetical protein RB595_006954 [Gaeumannomyces hyphopodioides]